MASIIKLLESILKTLSKDKEDKLVLNLEETINATGIKKSKLLEIINSENSNFPYFKNGRRILVNKEMLKEWLKDVAICHKEL